MFSDRYRASDYQNSWPKNYHELSYAWSNEKNYHDYHEEFEQAQTEW